MNVGEIIAELDPMLGNALKVTGHPYVTPTDMRYRWISRAANSIPRLAAAGGRDILSTFGELFGTWKDTTAHNIAYLGRPSDALIIREVYSFDKLSANVDVDVPRMLAELSPEVFDMGKNTGESPGYPHSVKFVAERVYFRPLPVTGYLTDVHYFGIARDVPFNSNSQTPLLREDWHEAILYEAARLGAMALGYWERAKEYKAHVRDLVTTGIEVPVQEDIYQDPTFELDGLLRQDEVYR